LNQLISLKKKSITFPNHWTLVTGLYPESHGIVANEFYDPILKQEFIHKDASISGDPTWWGGEPIWVTSTNQKKKISSDNVAWFKCTCSFSNA
jgi:predicted AlkP superfamily pyrophosphatase or phosphodiesterase